MLFVVDIVALLIHHTDVRVIDNAECPLNIQLQYGPLSNMLELRLVQVKQPAGPGPRARVGGGGNNGHRNHEQDEEDDDNDDDDVKNNRDITPKDEGELL